VALKQYRNLRASNIKLLSALCVGILLLVGYFITTNYYITLRKSKDEVLHRLMAISRTAALFVDGDAHERLSNQFMTKDAITQSNQDSSYLQLHLMLKKIKSENQLETPLYTIVYYDRDSTFHFIGTSSESPYFRHAYKNYPKELLTQHEIGGILDNYKDENGHWLSAFSPIKNSKGKVVGLLEADENFEMFTSRANKKLLSDSLVSLAIVVPFILLLFNYVSQSLRKQVENQAALINQKEEIESQNEEILTQNDLIERQNQELDTRVRERTAELEATNLELANFLYHSSHDVQAPIATLKGLQSLAGQETNEETTKKYLALMQNTTQQLERMVKTINLVHEIKTSVPVISKINLRNCVKESLKKAVNGSVGPEISNTIPDHVEVSTDKIMLQATLCELFKNSIQYKETSANKTLHLKVDMYQEGDQVNLIVEDNGEGISPEAKKGLFTMFRRGNEKSTGIGLGLYIAQVCLQRLKGNIELMENGEKGAKFIIRFTNLN
jgi:signal transduction histidine kinase